MSKSPLRAPQKSPPQPPAFDPALYASKNLPVDDVVKLKQCFDIFDYDKGGSISPQELTNSIKALGLQAQAGKILQIVNLHSDSEQLDFATFLEIFGFSSDNNSQKSLKQLFEVFDKNATGAFGVQEFAQVCQSVGQRFSMAEIQQMIDYADKDRDGKISYQEFVDIITKEYPQV